MPAAPQYPAPTWADGATPTVDQLKQWVRDHRPDLGYDARVAADMIVGMLADEQHRTRNLTMQLEACQAALGDVLTENRRNRQAWLSARRGRLAARQALTAIVVRRVKRP